MLASFSLRPRFLVVSAIAGLTISRVALAAPPVLPAPQTQSDPTSATPAAFRQESPSNAPRAAASDRSMSADAPIPSLMAGEGDYILAPGDTLDLMVYREPDLGMRSKIARDGRVQLPLLGEVNECARCTGTYPKTLRRRLSR